MLSMLPTWDQVEFWLFTTLCAGVGAYFGAYLKKRAENLATHADLEKLVAQMKATTEATKAIEARIDDQAWNKQRHWEMRRDALVKALQALGRAENALMELGSISRMKANMNDDERWQKELSDKADECLNAIDQFKNEEILVRMVCKGGVIHAFQRVGNSLTLNMSRLPRGATSWEIVTKELGDKIALVYSATREELGVDEEHVTPQSNESSATPGPDR
jgi:hypothetical protein